MAEPNWVGDEFVGGILDWVGGAIDKVGEALGTDNNEAIDQAIANLEDVKTYGQGISGTNKRLYGDWLAKMQGMYGGDVSNYNQTLADLRNAIDNYKDFEYTRDQSEFMDPAMAMRQREAAKQLNAAASAGGNRFSSNYQDKLMAQSQGIASEEWQKSFDRMMQDRAQQLNEWQTGQNKINNLTSMAQLYGQGRNQLSNALGDYYSSMANQNNADLESYSDLAMGQANLNSQRSSGIGSVLGSIGSAIGAMFA